MNKLLYKVASGIATASLLASSFAGVALADVNLEISGNGSDSDNNIDVELNNLTVIEQTNTANIQNNVEIFANTGNNEANDNTGGDVGIDTGNAKAEVNVSNTANSNVAEVNGCCPGDITAEISGNGTDSDNQIDIDVCAYNDECGTFIEQTNEANISNNVAVELNTGDNEANDNTGGDVEIDTGNAEANGGVTISNAVNSNVAVVGGGDGNSLTAVISGNGSDSDNQIDVEIVSLTLVSQENLANIENDVEIFANTGNNEANDNTGGDVEIDTGNAEAEVEISNLANFNGAEVDGCGCVEDLTAKIKNNGSDSENEIDVELISALFVEQLNEFECKEFDDPCADVVVESNTGDNEANDNTQDGDEPAIDTGNAGAEVEVENTANENVVGDLDGLDLPDLDLDGFSGLVLLLLALFS